MTELIPFRMMVECYMFAWDAPEDPEAFFVPGMSYRRDARDCQVCWYWGGETDEAIYCSFPNYRAEKIMEESDDDDAPGEVHGYATWEEIYQSSNRTTIKGEVMYVNIVKGEYCARTTERCIGEDCRDYGESGCKIYFRSSSRRMNDE